MLSLVLMNATGMFIEESESEDYHGLLSVLATTYLVAPFQAYAAIKGLFEKEEGHWFRTPKTGHITIELIRGHFTRLFGWLFPRRAGERVRRRLATAGASKPPANPYLALATANSQFDNFRIKRRRARWVSKAVLASLLAFAVTLFNLSRGIPEVLASNNPNRTQYISSQSSTITGSWQLVETADTQNTSTQLPMLSSDLIGRYAYRPGVSGKNTQPTCQDANATGYGWLLDTPFEQGGSIAQGTWDVTFYESDVGQPQPTAFFEMCAYRVTISGSAIENSYFIFDTTNMTVNWPHTDVIVGSIDNPTYTTDTVNEVTFNANDYLYVEYYLDITVQNKDYTSTFYTGDVSDPYVDPQIYFPLITIPENVVFLVAAAPFIPMVVMWIRQRRMRGVALVGY